MASSNSCSSSLPTSSSFFFLPPLLTPSSSLILASASSVGAYSSSSWSLVSLTSGSSSDVANQPLSLVREVVALWWKTKISKEVNEIKNNHKEKLRMETNLYLDFLVPSQEYYLHWKVHLPVRHLG